MVEQLKNPLHGVTLEAIVTALHATYGWEELGQQISIRCFLHEPSVMSSLKFLRRTPWAREKVESLYLFMLRERARKARTMANHREHSEVNVDVADPCSHVTMDTVRHVDRPPAGCVDCLAIGGVWVHLRICLTCGHVACCNSSPHQHATKHFHATQHPVMTSGEPNETWAWCFVDEASVSASESR